MHLACEFEDAESRSPSFMHSLLPDVHELDCARPFSEQRGAIRMPSTHAQLDRYVHGVSERAAAYADLEPARRLLHIDPVMPDHDLAGSDRPHSEYSIVPVRFGVREYGGADGPERRILRIAERLYRHVEQFVGLLYRPRADAHDAAGAGQLDPPEAVSADPAVHVARERRTAVRLPRV